MKEKHISDKISYISELFLEILVMQVRSLYEEYNEEDLDEFEIEYRENFRRLIRKKISEEDISTRITEFLSLERDEYGLDKIESNIKFILYSIFTEIGIELSIESIIIKEKWKSEQVGNLKDIVLDLEKLIEQSNVKICNLNNNIDMYKKEKKNLEAQIDLTKHKLCIYEKDLNKEKEKTINLNKEKLLLEDNVNKIKDKMKIVEKDINKFKNNNEILIEENNKLKIDLKQSKENVKSKNEVELTNQYNILKDEISRLENESEHFKKGISILKSQNREGINSIESLKKENDKIILENKELKNLSAQKEKYIKKLEIEINKFKQSEVELQKVSIEEIHDEYEPIHKKVIETLKEIVKIDKILNGKNIMKMASEINRLSLEIKRINERNELYKSINKIMSDLNQVDSLFKQNGKETGLKIHIQKLKKLESKI